MLTVLIVTLSLTQPVAASGILNAAEMRELLFPELSQALELRPDVFTRILGRIKSSLSQPILLKVDDRRDGTDNDQLVDPGQSTLAGRYAARLAEYGIVFKITDWPGVLAYFNPLELAVVLGRQSLGEKLTAFDVVARIFLRHETDHARTYLEYRAGIFSPWLIRFRANRGDALSVESKVYHTDFHLEELLVSAADLFDKAEYLKFFKPRRDQRNAYAITRAMAENIQILENLCRVVVEVTTRPQNDDVDLRTDTRLVRSDDPPHPWFTILFEGADRAARVTIPASVEFAYLIRSGRATDAEVAGFLGTQVAAMRDMAKAALANLAVVQTAFEMIRPKSRLTSEVDPLIEAAAELHRGLLAYHTSPGAEGCERQLKAFPALAPR